EIRTMTFNIAHNYMHLDALLESSKEDFEILFVQELPWQTVRRAPSMATREGEAMIGAPNHPNWVSMVRWSGEDENTRPRVMAYVSRRLAPLRPSMQSDILSHCNIIFMSLFRQQEVFTLCGIYSDEASTAIRLLDRLKESLSPCVYMAGDFNCHSKDWDPGTQANEGNATLLQGVAAQMGLDLATLVNLGPTFISRAQGGGFSVIDLVFVDSRDCLAGTVEQLPEIQGPSDHVPLSTVVNIGDWQNQKKRSFLDPEQEDKFRQATLWIVGAFKTSPTRGERAKAISALILALWNTHTAEKNITSHSRPWWNDACAKSLKTVRSMGFPKDWAYFRRTVKAAKRTFFDTRIAEVAVMSKRP
ncbi:Pol-like protein Pol-1, partial [Coprinopsis marcescibilis]